MIRRTLPAALALVAALTGCGSENEPAAGPSPTAVATTATPTRTAASRLPADPVTQELAERAICNRIVGLGDGDAEFDPAQNLDYGQQAEALVDPRMSRAGRDLVKAAGAAQVAPGPDTNIDISRAQLAVLDVCGDKYGDGPW